MRADVRNSGRSPLTSADVSAPSSVVLRRWSTGNGIFSTPIIGADETIYVGSADKRFYAFDPVSGAPRWSHLTGECIDSAGCIAADGTVYFVSCDAGLYALSPSGEERWRLNLFENRKHFTPSTIFWWEGNVVLGPNGLLYAGNDDFNFYAIEPGKGVRWAYLTGLHIWTAPAFGDDGSVCFLSFDRYCYKLDRETGELRWRTNTGNFVVSSPAVGSDGHIFFGSFDRHVYSLDGATGRVRWRVATGGTICASSALAEDGLLYIGSSDGCLYAIDSAHGRVIWSFYTGDAVRASAAIGPDPERQCSYLIYFGSGNGLLYCLEPSGRRRWSFRTVGEADELDSPNINASIALGRSGLAAATASGNVFYVPYRYYLNHTDNPDFDRRSLDGYPDSGIFFYSMTPGGVMAPSPTAESDTPLLAEPSQPISLRVLARDGGRTRPVELEANGVEVTMEPPRTFRVTLQPNRAQVNVVPEAAVASESGCSVKVRARCRIDGGRAETVEGRLPVRYLPAVDAPPIEALVEMPFRITHMSIYDPAIVPSFDQIGIASLALQVRIVHVDSASGKVVAWGVEKFGIGDGGDAVQVAIPRHLFYAFGGTYENGRLVLTARDCHFELTAFPVPLDLLRLAGTWQGAEGPSSGSSLLAELDVAGRFRWRGRRLSMTTVARNLRALTAFVGRWTPDPRAALRSLPLLIRFLARALPLSARMLRREMYAPWGLIGDDGWFRGVGSFRSSADRGLDEAAVEVRAFRHEPASARIVGEITARRGHEHVLSAALPGILIVDTETSEPLALRYTGETAIHREAGRLRIELALPPSDGRRAGSSEAHLLVDTTPLARLRL